QGLDVHGQAEFYAMLEQIRDQRRCGIVMVSHDLHMVMATTDWVLCINGHVCCEGSPQEVRHDPRYVALFGGEHPENVAVYAHHHDHEHDAGGDVIQTERNHAD